MDCLRERISKVQHWCDYRWWHNVRSDVGEKREKAHHAYEELEYKSHCVCDQSESPKRPASVGQWFTEQSSPKHAADGESICHANRTGDQASLSSEK